MVNTLEVLVTTEDGQEVAGRLQLDGAIVKAFPAEGFQDLMRGILERPIVVDNGARSILQQTDPEKWFANLPANFRGAYLRVREVGVQKFVPPVEVRDAARFACQLGPELGNIVPGVTEDLASEEGLVFEQVELISKCFDEHNADAWGGVHAQKWANRVIRKFNPDQDRDEHGRWSSGSDAENVPEGHRDFAGARDPASLVSFTRLQGEKVPANNIKTWVNTVTPQEKNSLAEYKSFGFAKVNSFLVTGKAANENVKPTAKDVAGVMKRSQLSDDATVYRGVNGALAEKLQGLKVGDTGKFPCYQSTTTSLHLAKDFATGKLGEAARVSRSAVSPTVLHIDAPKGYGAIPIAKLSGYAETEKELVLNKGGAFTVLGKQEIDGVTHVHLKVSK